MPTQIDVGNEPEQLFTAVEVGQLLGVSARMVLLLPIRQQEIGGMVGYRLQDVYDYSGMENPNLE